MSWKSRVSTDAARRSRWRLVRANRRINTKFEEEHGQERIIVTDNDRGMTREELEKALLSRRPTATGEFGLGNAATPNT
jgi:hypothetical protein